MPRQAPVTDDLTVLKAVQNSNDAGQCEYSWSAKEIGEMLDLTPFQITARLAAMEKRGLMGRDAGDWFITEQGHEYIENPPPPKKSIIPGQKVYRTPTGGMYTPGVSVLNQEEMDKKVPRSKGCVGWSMKYEYHTKGYGQKMSETKRTVYIDLEGDEWVDCMPDEKADLIVDAGKYTLGLSSKRLRRLRMEEMVR